MFFRKRIFYKKELLRTIFKNIQEGLEHLAARNDNGF